MNPGKEIFEYGEYFSGKILGKSGSDFAFGLNWNFYKLELQNGNAIEVAVPQSEAVLKKGQKIKATVGNSMFAKDRSHIEDGYGHSERMVTLFSITDAHGKQVPAKKLTF